MNKINDLIKVSSRGTIIRNRNEFRTTGIYELYYYFFKNNNWFLCLKNYECMKEYNAE